MAMHLIDDIPVGDAKVGIGVVARQMHLALKHLPVRPEALLHKQAVHPIDEQAVQGHYHEEGDKGHQPLFRLDPK